MVYLVAVLTSLLLLFLLLYILQRLRAIGSIRLSKQLKSGLFQQSLQFKNGRFHNELPVQSMAEGVNAGKLIKKLLNGKPKRAFPDSPIKNLAFPAIDLTIDQFIWLGHSSYLMILDGKTILVDPVLSRSISPLGLGLKSFKMTYRYTPEDLPVIDYLVITHDHWDHLDYRTICQLKPKIKKIITTLGVSAHFEKWGFDTSVIHELDWWQSIQLGSLHFTATPAQHFSGRWFRRNNTLWTSFVLYSQQQKIYIGGDSGYGPHFKQIGEKFSIEWAFLENGQYDAYWPAIHMHPNECIQAANDIHTKYMVPVHNSKFSLAYHDWDAPLRNVSDFKNTGHFTLITPTIGAVVKFNQPAKSVNNWWLY
ncbi:MBL fold metallo-hydrolase [Gynurincola endophyticus]|uniref:MBL fold metallo-hydrolase n=1 Tax=Gynurincola endophyticus TaxID=2479004 RepID=UPI000F8C62E0|nr:MBL fold metallo-hydrolase [Gynurincola endophyticus]